MAKRTIILSVLAGMLLAMPGCRGEPPGDTAPHASARGAEAREKPIQASVNRDVFHRSDCRWAEKISERNLAGYDAVQDARADGRRACQVCKP